MKQVFRINEIGEYVEPVILRDGDEIPIDCVEDMPTEGLFKAKWNGTAWEEGLTQTEIDAIKNAPVQPSELDNVKKQLADFGFELMIKGVI
jgi:hypothetical protein